MGTVENNLHPYVMGNYEMLAHRGITSKKGKHGKNPSSEKLWEIGGSF